MRILYIDVVCKKGSTGKIVYDLYTQSRADGHTAAICYGRGDKVEGEHIYKFGLDWETYLHALLTRLTGWTGCFSFFSTRRLLKFVRKFQPDVVHIHELHAYFVNLKPLLRYLAEQHIPVVQTLHCEFTYTGKCGHSYECTRWHGDCGHCPHLRDYPKTLWFDHTAAMLRQKKALFGALDRLTVTAPSAWLADQARESFLKNRKICVVHNGIDTEHVFHPYDTADLRAQHGLMGERVVLAVAPDLLSQRKGGRWVLQLAERMPEVKFVLVGAEDTSGPFPPNVIVLGPIYDQPLLARYYAMADCFVICSEKETFSMTCAESLCCGTPVAGFCSGAPETIFLPPYGRFVPYGDIFSLQAAVERQLAGNMDAAAVAEDAAERYSQERMYSGYLKIYQSFYQGKDAL